MGYVGLAVEGPVLPDEDCDVGGVVICEGKLATVVRLTVGQPSLRLPQCPHSTLEQTHYTYSPPKKASLHMEGGGWGSMWFVGF